MEDLKKHRFFAHINWSDLAEKKVKPPFTPLITSEDDVRNIHKSFLEEDPSPETFIESDFLEQEDVKDDYDDFNYIRASLLEKSSVCSTTNK